MNEIKRMSKSRVLLYAGCPLKYKFIKILRIPMVFHPSAGIGKEVHKVCENFYKEFKFDNEHQRIEQAKIEIDILLKKLTPKDIDEKGLDYIKNFGTYVLQTIEYANNKKIKYYNPKYTELKVVNEEHNIIGYIDRVEFIYGIGWVVIDYKTGTPKNIREYMYELSLYAWLIENDPKIPIDKIVAVGIVKLKNKGKILDIKPVTDEDKMKALALTKQVRDLIADEQFEPKKGKDCYWCPSQYKSLCEKLKNGEIKHETYEGQY